MKLKIPTISIIYNKKHSPHIVSIKITFSPMQECIKCADETTLYHRIDFEDKNYTNILKTLLKPLKWTHYILYLVSL